jgi:methanogenic corrinoid protein MtbC1
MEPPILSQYSDAPVYEVGTLAQLLRVRPLALWTWEQQLGITTAEQSADPSRQKRRYSERDMIALMWLRDMVIAGESPHEAAARLLAAQRGMRGVGYGVSGALLLEQSALEPPTYPGSPYAGQASGPLNSGALQAPLGGYGQQPMYDPSQYGGVNTPWTTPSTSGLGAATYSGMNASSTRPAPPARGVAPDGWGSDQWATGAINTPTETRPGGFSGPLRTDVTAPGMAAYQAPQQGGPSGRLGAVYGATLEPPAYSARGRGMSQSLNSLRELRPAVPQLLQSFARFDTARANAVMSEALRLHGVENVCIGLVQPAVTRISELWSKSELSNPEERFGLNYLRAFMFSVFHSTQEPMGAPFTVVGCAPNETSDFGALLLAVLWRRAGLRVAYLGRGVDGDQLLQEPWSTTPAIIALTATTSQRMRALQRIGKRLGEAPRPQPVFAYWGPIFVRNPDLKRKLTGVYLGDDAMTATRQARRVLGLDGDGE